MIFRLRRYKVISGKVEAFNEFFLEYLLPVQQRHGARLVGRWATEDGTQVFAIWVYESREHYEEIHQRVGSDPNALAAQAHRRATLDPLFTETEEEFVFSTVPLALTELAHLDKRADA
jgi:8-oxo-dGTP diphosphatase